MDKKIGAFEYLVSNLVSWHKEVSGKDKNDISVLKSLKLLFFVSAVGASKDSDHTLLDETFDSFVAMPYGHVESDVYNNIKADNHLNIIVNNRNTVLKSPEKINVSSQDKELIDKSLNCLKEINPNLIKLSSFDLVDLSHNWYSWQFYFKKAKLDGKDSHPIPTKAIKEEEKIFQL